MSLELLLLREIYAFNQFHGRWPTFSEMVEDFEDLGITLDGNTDGKHTVSVLEDVLNDRCLIESYDKWITLEDGSSSHAVEIYKFSRAFAKLCFEDTEGLPVR